MRPVLGGAVVFATQTSVLILRSRLDYFVGKLRLRGAGVLGLGDGAADGQVGGRLPRCRAGSAGRGGWLEERWDAGPGGRAGTRGGVAMLAKEQARRARTTFEHRDTHQQGGGDGAAAVLFSNILRSHFKLRPVQGGHACKQA